MLWLGAIRNAADFIYAPSFQKQRKGLRLHLLGMAYDLAVGNVYATALFSDEVNNNEHDPVSSRAVGVRKSECVAESDGAGAQGVNPAAKSKRRWSQAHRVLSAPLRRALARFAFRPRRWARLYTRGAMK